MRCLSLSVVSSMVMLVSVPSSFGQQARPADGDIGKKIYQRVLKSTVCVIHLDGNKIVGQGSGALIDHKRKWVLTNYHVVGKGDKALVLFPAFEKNKSGKLEVISDRDSYFLQLNQRAIIGKVIDRKPECDLALIELASVPEAALALPVAREGVGPGDRVHSIGNPGASDALWVYTSGTVRQVYKKKFRTASNGNLESFQVDARVVETQSPVNAGDSGGPVVNDRAELVAVTQSMVSDSKARSFSYFIDVSEVQRLPKAKGLKFVVATANSSSKEPVQAASDKPPAVKVDDAERMEQVANAKLTLAKALADDGLVKRACERCESIIKDYPKTKAAAEAKKLLEKLTK